MPLLLTAPGPNVITPRPLPALDLNVARLSSVPEKPQPPDYAAIKRASDKRLEAERAQKAREAAERTKESERLVALAKVSAGSYKGSVQSTATINPPTEPTVGLIGSYGYARAGGNCVNTARAWGKSQPGNPISWTPTTQTPFIGAAALFHFNHVGVVQGLHEDGSLEIVHENCGGCPSRYPRFMFRGFF